MDCIKIQELLKEVNMMSVNQTTAQVKLTEMWKAVHDVSFPIKVQLKSNQEKGMTTRSCTCGEVVEVGSSTKTIKSFIGSASRLWNKAPEKIRNASTIWQAKAEIKKFCLSLPCNNYSLKPFQCKKFFLLHLRNLNILLCLRETIIL